MIGNGYGNSSFLGTHGILARSSSGGVPPTNTVAPVISGTQVVGSTLTSTTGTWIGTAPITYTYQWYRGATLISGSTSSTYVLVQADAGNTSNITCKVTGTNGSGSATATSNTLAQILDFDANAFITSASITDTTQKAATNSLTIDLKSFGLFTLPNLVVYPMVGGTNTSTSFNLVNPALYQVTWNGGVVSSNNGVQFNGVNAYGNTNFNPTTVGTGQNSFHLSFYSRTNSNGTEIEIGGQDATGAIGSLIEIRTSGTTYYRVNSAGSYITYVDANSLGFYVSNRTASNVVNGWKNGVKVATGTTASSGNFNGNIWIGAWNNLNGASKFYSTKQAATVTMGSGLTDTQAANLRTAIQTFNTTLGRQV